jgi:hypothetical protein
MIESKIQICCGVDIVRPRTIPSPADVLVRKGERITSEDIIAISYTQPEHFPLDIARGLGVSKKEAGKYLQFGENEPVSKGHIVAGPVGFTKRVVRAPISGRIIDIEDGIVIIRNQGEPDQLKAGLSGEVGELIPGRGAVVKSFGSVIQGIWGNGQLGAGEMVMLQNHPKDEFVADDLGSYLRNKVIVGGYCKDVSLIKKTAELALKGLILPSISPDLFSFLKDLPFAVIILEGFGKRSINSKAYELIRKNTGQYVEIIGEPLNRTRGLRPEVIIPEVPGEINELPEPEIPFIKGQMVKVISPPHFGKIGMLYKKRGVTRLPNGLYAASAEVLFEDHSLATVPLANVEFLV